MTKAVVTGIGPVSAIGEGVDQFWEGLVAGRSGIAPITRVDVTGLASKVGAEVRNFELERYTDRGKALARTIPRSISLGLGAGALAVQDSARNLQTVDRARIGG